MAAHSWCRRTAWWLTVTTLVGSLVGVAGPAAAAAPQLSIVATPAVVHVGSPIEVTGSVSSHSGSVALQRFSANRWTTVAHARTNPAGHFTLSVKAPKRATTLVLRVTRPAAASRTVRVRVVTHSFAVKATTAATVASGAPVVVTGAVSPQTPGSVWLQALSGKVWHNVVSARLTTGGHLRLSASLAAGAHALRVMRPFTSTVAGGVSKTMNVVVTSPPVVPLTPPAVTTTTLPPGTAGFSYSAQLVATGGASPFTWSATGLPAGLTVSAAGAITGAPETSLTATVTVTVTDRLGRSATAALALTVASTTAASWGAGAHGQLGNGLMADAQATVVAGLTNVTSLAGGYVNGYASLAGGSVWAWGENDQGQLGDGSSDTTDVVLAPVQVTGLTGATDVVAGRESAYALRSDGTVWAWGFNGFGNLGNGSTDNSSTPVEVSGLTGVVAVAAGGDDGYALKADGTVWAWGINTGDQLGDGLAADSHVPVQVSGLGGIAAIAAGTGAAYALKADGTVWSWGSNADGELGDGTTTPRSTPVQATGLSGITAIGAGATAGYAVGPGGRLWAWGGNAHGELGTGGKVQSLVPTELSSLSGVVSVTGGTSDLYALEADGSVWVAGYNGNDEYGPGAFSSTPLFYYPGAVRGLGGVVAIGAGASSLSAYAVVRD